MDLKDLIKDTIGLPRFVYDLIVYDLKYTSLLDMERELGKEETRIEVERRLEGYNLFSRVFLRGRIKADRDYLKGNIKD